MISQDKHGEALEDTTVLREFFELQNFYNLFNFQKFLNFLTSESFQKILVSLELFTF